jgi:O-antigen/teichoic acid export membrane protein
VNKPPPLWPALAGALILSLAIVSFGLQMLNDPTLTVKIAAGGIVLLVTSMVAVWHWGFRAGRRPPDNPA